MSSRQPETILVYAIKKTIEAAYPHAVIYKIHGSMFSASGMPDLLVFVEGRTVCLEVKRQKPGEALEAARNRCSPMQSFTINRLRRAGIAADCVLSPAEAMAVIQSNGSRVFLEAVRPVTETA